MLCYFWVECLTCWLGCSLQLEGGSIFHHPELTTTTRLSFLLQHQDQLQQTAPLLLQNNFQISLISRQLRKRQARWAFVISQHWIWLFPISSLSHVSDAVRAHDRWLMLLTVAALQCEPDETVMECERSTWSHSASRLWIPASSLCLAVRSHKSAVIDISGWSLLAQSSITMQLPKGSLCSST